MPLSSTSSDHPPPGASISRAHASARGSSDFPSGARSAPQATTSVEPATAAQLPARGVGPGAVPETRRSHAHDLVSSAQQSLSMSPDWAAPPKTMRRCAQAAAAWRPLGDGASPVVGCSTSLSLASSKTSTEEVDRWVCTTMRPSTVAATCREHMGQAINGRNDNCREADPQRHYTQ